MSDATKLVDLDREFVGLRFDESMRRARFMVIDAFSNPRGSFYGGAGVAATVAMMEAVTGRRALWTTLQFLATAARGDELECVAEVLTHGKRSSQVRVTVLRDDEVMFTAMGATGDPRTQLTATFDPMPAVPRADDCPTIDAMVPGDLSRSRFASTEHRLAAEGDDLRARGSQVAYWVRVGDMPATPAVLGYVSDAIALGVFRAVDVPMSGGTSLDNTLRIGAPVDTEWVLLEVHGHAVVDGYAHGTAYVWAPDGTLLALASQTLVLRPA
jgi:acyl-CoA thioesterase